MRATDTPTLKASLRQLILDALKLSYVSASVKDGTPTGNHYQSITLGEEHTDGFRSDRQVFLDQIAFAGKRVLDLGSNLGEISRAARTRGAIVADGFESDPFFVELANTINAYNGTTRVSFYERDITDPKVYGESYDIVLALSVYIYIQDVLVNLAKITTGLLVVETHRLEKNLESTYLQPISEHFPYHMFLGASDWGAGLDTRAQRAVIAFAKTEESLRKHLSRLPEPDGPRSVDRRRGTMPDIRELDVHRTPWYDQFFSAFVFKSANELLSAVDNRPIDIDALVADPDFSKKGMRGWVYWLIYLKGALEYGRNRVIDGSNCYYDMLARHWVNDPGRTGDYRDPQRLTVLVRRRFDDFENFRAGPTAAKHTSPLGLVIPSGPAVPTRSSDVKRVYEVGAEIPIETTVIDGYHRLFLARLFGLPQIPCDFVAERDALPDATI